MNDYVPDRSFYISLPYTHYCCAPVSFRTVDVAKSIGISKMLVICCRRGKRARFERWGKDNDIKRKISTSPQWRAGLDECSNDSDNTISIAQERKCADSRLTVVATARIRHVSKSEPCSSRCWWEGVTSCFSKRVLVGGWLSRAIFDWTTGTPEIAGPCSSPDSRSTTAGRSTA